MFKSHEQFTRQINIPGSGHPLRGGLGLLLPFGANKRCTPGEFWWELRGLLFFFVCVCVLMWKDIQQLKMAMFFGSKIGQTIVPIYFYQTWSCNLERLQTNKFFFNLKTLKDCRWISFSLIWKPRDSFITENCARLPLEGGVVRPVGPQNEQPMKVNSNDEDGWF